MSCFTDFLFQFDGFPEKKIEYLDYNSIATVYTNPNHQSNNCFPVWLYVIMNIFSHLI